MSDTRDATLSKLGLYQGHMRNKWLTMRGKELWDHGRKILNTICVAGNQRSSTGEGLEPVFDVG